MGVALCALTGVATSSCAPDPGASAGPGTGLGAAAETSGAASRPTRAVVAASEAVPDSWGLGSHAVDSFVAAWDRDVGPDGAGLPPGRGTVAEGAALFERLCASCHGVRGEGMSINPTLVHDGTPEERFRARAIGEFWPYATTLYDYLRRSMPQTAPGTLTPDETYALVAWLLAENGRIDRDVVMDAEALTRVEMPGRTRFVPDDRTGGPQVR